MGIKVSAVQRLVNRIESDFETENWIDGELIGTEDELCANYQVSPTVFRQAARVLESSGFAVMRPGNRGGLIAKGASVGGAANALATYLQCTGVAEAEARQLTRPLMSMTISEALAQLTLADVEILRETVREYESIDEPYEKGLKRGEIFQRLADATHNPILALLHRAMIDYLASVTPFEVPKLRAALADARLPENPAGQIIEWVIGGDGMAASQWLSTHDANNQRIVAIRSAFAQAEARPAPIETGSERTRSARLARMMLREISDSDWPPGTRLGNQFELMERFSVSRGTYRQAVRLLEQYCAVEGRAGKGGGLFVAAPNPDRITEIAFLALRRAGALATHRSQVLWALTILALEAALRSPVQDPARMLHTAIAQAGISGRGRSDTGENRLANVLLEASGKRALAFAYRLVERFQPVDARQKEPGAVGTIEQTFVAALEAGDMARARRALRDLASAS